MSASTSNTGTSAFTVRVGNLEPALAAQWLAMTESAPDCSSPFLHPSYAQVVGRVRPGVEVAVITQD